MTKRLTFEEEVAREDKLAADRWKADQELRELTYQLEQMIEEYGLAGALVRWLRDDRY